MAPLPDNQVIVAGDPSEYTWEFRNYDDDAWYSVSAVPENGGEALRIKFMNFADAHDHVFQTSHFKSLKELEDFKNRLRPVSLQLQDYQCSSIQPEMKVCACHRNGVEDVRFYDAIVDEVQEKEHSWSEGEEVCLCTFSLYWLHGPVAETCSNSDVADICKIQPTTELDPVVASFLKLARDRLEVTSSNSNSYSKLGSGLDVVPLRDGSQKTRRKRGFFERLHTTIPRTVVFDEKRGTDILQWPVEEIESLRLTNLEFEGLVIKPASLLPLDIGSATQLDIFAEFEIEWLGSQSQGNNGENSTVGCGSGAIDRSDFGPFGILALADDTLSELTPIYFRPSNATLANSTTFFCTDETRSSKALDVSKNIYGTDVPVLSDEKLSMRVLVDHSVIESFAQGGRRVITSRIYPTEAIYGAAKLFVFNNATDINVKVSLKIWQLNSAFIRPFPFDQIQRKL